MNLDNSYKINEPSVVSDLIDNELIIIHMETGAYFTANATGTLIWSLLQQGATVRQIANGILVAYESDPMTVAFEIAPFITALMEQDLVKVQTQNAPVTIDVPAKTPKLPFTTPHLEIYRDMQNLLMIDPIHEVDTNIGWPVQENQ